MPLPEGYVKEGLKLAKDCSLFGQPIENLTRDELLAAAAHGYNCERMAREENIRQLRILRQFRDNP